MNKLTGSILFLGVILSGNWLDADEVSKSEPRPPASAKTVGISSSPSASPDSATPPGTNQLAAASSAHPLPPLPPGVTELKFSEFFRQPIGPRGLEYTEKLRALDGRRIRILGFMARQTKPAERCFLLSPVPLTLNEVEYGHADDLPATAIHVFTTSDAPAATPFTPGLLLLTGKLSLGNRLEADGRTSTVRLFLDPPTPEQKHAAEQAARQAAKAAGPDDHAGHGHEH